ncbi:hypothetical protein GCM10011492_15540 [Flexivirga endophytica]|uniref:UvrD-like helicase ATP-binding domain-containing protein n=1 Tax=Flexivirga endophytica TaxID=1849103 RepID=A0A916WRM2_9MICO|nr:hypothetical protein GCM10011492_15540 [Flexivirga endophytica]GHB54752.1 hypothetical protein GCM10008112_24860 [Flexivirga endophytica]
MGARVRRLNIEAGPGTGKTTVSARRFGVERFAREYRGDPRAVVAVSFTRAATHTLVRRIRRLWGSHAIRWPHRVVTLDTVMVELLHDLLLTKLVVWPGGHTTLVVEDSWASYGTRVRTFAQYKLTISGAEVQIGSARLHAAAYTVNPSRCASLIRQGICTHSDVRQVLALALRRVEVREYARKRFASRFRSFIVDEVYDANDLDIDFIELAVDGGVSVTLVGDDWQALYVFRGARPEVVPELLSRQGFRSLTLTRSFRWRSEEQAQLADDLRGGIGVTLPVVLSADVPCLDVVLSLRWAPLWNLGPGVLPIGFQSFKGGPEEAAAILVLNHVTTSIFGTEATYVKDAVTSLSIDDEDFFVKAKPRLQQIVDVLSSDGTATAKQQNVKTAYSHLGELLAEFSPRTLRPVRANHTNRLRDIQARLLHPVRPVPGLTAHQAKGAEWNYVGVCLADAERALLHRGLHVEGDSDRKLYVACTRACFSTAEVVVSS